MSDDGVGPRRRANDDSSDDLDDESLQLCLSPPSLTRSRHPPPQPLTVGDPSLELSPPGRSIPRPLPHSPVQQGPPQQTFPFPQTSSVPMTAAPAPPHVSAPLSSAPGMVPHHHHHQYSQFFHRPNLTLPPQHLVAVGSSPSPVPCAASYAAGAPPSVAAPIAPPNRGIRARRNPSQGGPRGGKDETIEAPFRWATNRRAVVHSKSHLLAHGIRTISGEVQCKRCEHRGMVEYDLQEKYAEVARFIAANKHQMHDRAPPEWTNPAFPSCPGCNQHNCLKPVIASKKRAINWLFLLLGQTLGCCTLEQLKYFCKHTRNHRTGAKDRVLYLAFLGICKQLEPIDMFEFDR